MFSVIGAARTDSGDPVVEGLLDLVHLDHAIALTGEIPATATELTVTARTGAVRDADVGRVVEVTVEIAGPAGPVATLERGGQGHGGHPNGNCSSFRPAP